MRKGAKNEAQKKKKKKTDYKFGQKIGIIQEIRKRLEENFYLQKYSLYNFLTVDHTRQRNKLI